MRRIVAPIIVSLVCVVMSAAPPRTDSPILHENVQNGSGDFDILVYNSRDAVTFTVFFAAAGRRHVIASASNPGFLYVRRDPDGNRVISVWQAGTAFTTVISTLDPSDPHQTECGSVVDPNFIHGAKRDYMLQYDGKDFLADGTWEPKYAYIYFWMDEEYHLAKMVSFATRFDELKRLDSLARLSPSPIKESACLAR